MGKKITFLFGAGASLDFVEDWNEVFDDSLRISTYGLTELILTKESNATKEDPRVLPFLRYCNAYLDQRYGHESNFEDIYQLLLDLIPITENYVPVLDFDTS